MKKIILVGILSSFLYSSYSQKVVKMYFNGNHLLSLDHQVDPKTGVENGYYKQYEYSGRLAEEGFYKMGRKNGVWKKYNQYGQIIAYDTYKNDTLNGLKKQFCDNDSKGGIYQCYESIYKNGEEMFSTKFYPNGKKMFYYDKEKGTEIKYSIKGEPDTKLINGRTYRYNIDDDGNNLGLYEIIIDTIGFNISYRFETFGDGHGSNDTTKKVRSIRLDSKGKDIVSLDSSRIWDFSENGPLNYYIPDSYYHSFRTSHLSKFDEASYLKGIDLYNKAPNPSNKNYKFIYDSSNQTITVHDNKTSKLKDVIDEINNNIHNSAD